jgi:hypothetical protein
MPMLNGTGIKNKLLEAASMARPIVATPLATRGLVWEDPAPWRRASAPAEWVAALSHLWSSPTEPSRLGRRAREWVTAHHQWAHAAGFRESFVRSIRPLRVPARAPAQPATLRKAA